MLRLNSNEGSWEDHDSIGSGHREVKEVKRRRGSLVFLF